MTNDSGWNFIIGLAVVMFVMCGIASMVDAVVGTTSSSSYTSSGSSDINYILRAKDYVRRQLNYPDTADFHELSTRVDSTSVHLVVTAKNAFGVPETLTFDVPKSAL